MRRASLTLGIHLATLVAACAASPRQRSPSAGVRAPPEGLAHSSIAAVLAERAALGLSDMQVAQLEDLDGALMLERLALRRESDVASPGPPRARPETGRALGQTAEPGRRDPGGPAMLPGGMGIPGAGSGGPGMPRAMEAPGPRRVGPAPSETAPEDRNGARLDDADTRAWLRAEDALAPEQRERARAIASEYRARFYDQREAARQERSR
jgi:hypothetical protein